MLSSKQSISRNLLPWQPDPESANSTGRGGSIEESGTTTFGTCCAEGFLANLGCPQAQTRRPSKP